MSKINVGISTTGNTKVNLDLDILLRTRLLIQANSGGGKSWLLRRICEQAFGKVQIIVIDPEGEFSTLREKFDFVLVGKGGETPADVRSASLVALKLLELNASAICDLFEMKVSHRHEWVRSFLDTLVDSPKNLWHPILVIVDEAHTYAPEKGFGESIASDSMIGLVTKGRKRGFCAIFATQRLGKLRKDAAAELLNVLIGQTFIDIDRKRAADSLGIRKQDKNKFFDEMKVIEPGNFYVLGRAISKERILVKVGDVSTTHPEPGSKEYSATPPPTPAKIQSLLPKLSDLPKEAETKVRTEAELRAEISSLKRQLNSRPTVSVPEVKVERMEVPVLKDQDIDRLEKAAQSMADIGTRLSTAARDIFASIKSAKISLPASHNSSHPFPAKISRPLVPVAETSLNGPEQRILDAIAWFESIGQSDPKQTGVAFIAGYSYGGVAFNNPRSSLRTKGLVEYRSDRISLTDQGRSLAQCPAEPLTIESMHEHVFKILPTPERRILEPLLRVYPNSMDKADLAAEAGYAQGGAFNNPLGRLRTLGLIDYPERNKAVALPILFLE